jgi:LemA protein
MGRLMVVSEQYPTLQANKNFQDLQVQLESTENRITVARNDYNESVKEFNIGVRKFPMNLIAGLFKMSTKPTFEADAASQKAPSVQF